MPESQPLKPELESESKRKENSLALQKMGESLTKLTQEQLVKMELPGNLLHAIDEFKSLKSNEAKRRQMQYIGKLMREIDPESIQQTLKSMELVHEKNTKHFKLAEAWRAKFIAQGDNALNSFLTEYPVCDRQQLRQLIRKAQHDNKNEKNTGAEKILFKYVFSLIENK